MELPRAITYAINKYKTISDFAHSEDMTDDYLNSTHAWDSYGSEQQGLISASIVHTLCMMVYEEMKLEDDNNG